MKSAPNPLCAAIRLSLIATTFAVALPVSAQDGGPHLEEVVVTAQRRMENLQRVPVAVTAVTAADLDNAHVGNIENIQAVSPSINFDVTNSAANSANIRIRGIGTVGNSRAFEGAVGVFIDGVYRTRAGQALQNWLDIDSLQILRGPQGTLFGKNTSAGALIVNSKAPNLNTVEGDYEFTVANYNTRLARGALNVPLTDTFAVRAAALWSEADGFIDNPNGGNYNDRAPRAGKIQFLFEPSDKLSMHLIADYSDEENNCCYGQVDAVDGPLQPFINTLTQMRGLQPPSAKFTDYEQVLSNDTRQSVTDKGAVLNIDWELSSAQTLHSATAYRVWNISQQGMDADFSGANILTINESFNTKFFSQEFTLTGDMEDAGPFASLDYVIGVYYADEDIGAHHQLLWGDQAQLYFNVLLGASGLPPGTANAQAGLWSDANFPASSKSYAAFTHWDFGLTDDLNVIVGLRYSKDEKEGAFVRNYFTPIPNTAFRVLGVQPGPTYDDNYDHAAVSGTFALQYQLNEDTMTYASYSRGYKSGGVNIDNTAAGTRLNNPAEIPGAVPKDPTYKAEIIDGYEIGLKTNYFDSRARTNIALFYDDMTDLQVAQFLGTQFTIVNAPDAKVYGAEMENEFALTDVLTLKFDVTYLAEAKFGKSSDILNLSDREFAQAPELAGNLALALEQPLGDNFALLGNLGFNYTGEQYTNTSNDLTRDAETEVNFSLGLKSVAMGWTVSAWCQNCTDERYVVQHFNSPLQGADANAYVAAPRTYGVTVRGSF